jgi:hypothetical protein
MGRGRWTNRLTVEECHALQVGELVRAGCLKAGPGALFVSTWKDSNQAEILRIPFTVHRDHFNKPALRLHHRIAATRQEPLRTDQQIVPLTATRCHFGGVRHWFRCLNVRNGYPCNLRAGVLYSTPYHHRFSCRLCLNLTYRSAQTHDKRIDRLLKLTSAEFDQVFDAGTIRQKLLAVRASTRMYERSAARIDRSRKPRRDVTACAPQTKNGIRTVPGPDNAFRSSLNH